MTYLQEMSKTGILFLVYSSIPISLLCHYSNQLIVLSDEGSVLYYGRRVREW